MNRTVAGSLVLVTTASGEEIPMIARSAVVRGRDMPIIWVSDRDEYAERGQDAHQIPWPFESVRRDQ